MRVLGALAAAVALAALPGSAGAGFPGRNGAIVVSSTQSSVASGEVYAVAPDGTGRVNLTRNPAADSDAVWSPDGTRIAFERDTSVAVMDAHGSSQLVLGGGSEPAWAPDGRRLAFVRDGAVWTSSTTGTGAQELTGADVKASWPAWSPDGSSIAFVKADSFLEVVPSGGGAIRELARGVSAARGGFVWAKDGKSILYGNAFVLYRVSVDGASDVVLLRAPAPIGDLVLAPRGDAVAFSVAPYGPAGTSGVWTLDLLGPPVARQQTSSGDQQDSLLTWSPSGGEIAFVRSPDVRIHVVVLGTTGQRTLPPEHPGTFFDSLAWSPDDKELLFTSTFEDDAELYSMTPSASLSGPQRRLTTNWAEDVDPAWSPDGSTIAFASDRSGNFEIYTMRADGSGVRRLTRDPAVDRYPAWSPDGSRIVFSSARLVSAQERKAKKQGYGVAHLYVMWADGTHQRRLTGGVTVYDVTPAWSPDGSLIAFANGDDDPPDLETVRSGGTGQRGTGATGLYPDWSPDGSQIAFLHVYYPDGYRARPSSPPPQVETALLTLAGRGLTPLGDHGPARWSPDGQELATGYGSVIDSTGATIATIAVGDPSWQPLCTIDGDGHANVLRVRSAGATVCGLGGNDRIVATHGGDRLFGGAGDDVIDARNGRFDVIGCGPGVDTVSADPHDLVGADCERVTR
jgi:Tol biopolymer transport system component